MSRKNPVAKTPVETLIDTLAGKDPQSKILFDARTKWLLQGMYEYFSAQAGEQTGLSALKAIESSGLRGMTITLAVHNSTTPTQQYREPTLEEKRRGYSVMLDNIGDPAYVERIMQDPVVQWDIEEAAKKGTRTRS